MAKFRLYRDSRREFRWSLRSDGNGKIIAVSSEGYVAKADALAAIVWTRANSQNAKLEDLT